MIATDSGQATSEKATSRFGPVPLSIPHDRFQAMVETFVAESNLTPELAMQLKTLAWLLAVDSFRDQEERLPLESRFEDTSANHRVILSDLIADGEEIVWAVKKVRWVGTKFTIEDLQATLASLHRTFRCEHGPRNSERTNELIAQLFDGSQC
jgi:hypothetical protein